MVLKEIFFNRPTVKVAKELLGKFLVRRWRGQETALMINEVEVYDGFSDKASHAACGLTERNKPMFGPAGRWYVYFTYGLHWMLNIVMREKGYPAAILIRGAGNINGPARLTKFLDLDKKFNGRIAGKETGLWIEDRGVVMPQNKIAKSPRIGINYAGPIWSKKLYRFFLK